MPWWLAAHMLAHASRPTRSRVFGASLCYDIYSAQQRMAHHDLNVVCIGAQIVGQKIAEDFLRAFLAAKFSTGAVSPPRVQTWENRTCRSTRVFKDTLIPQLIALLILPAFQPVVAGTRSC